MLGAMDDLCYPFLDESFNIYFLDAKVVIEQNVTAELMQVKKKKRYWKKATSWVYWDKITSNLMPNQQYYM